MMTTEQLLALEDSAQRELAGLRAALENEDPQPMDFVRGVYAVGLLLQATNRRLAILENKLRGR